VRRFAEAIGWPLLADPLHGGRGGPAAVASYDALLRDGAFRAGHRPDVVVRIGDLPTSKPLRRWLAGLHDVEQIAFDPSGVWHDPDGVVSAVLHGHPPAVLGAVDRGALSGDPEEPWGPAHALQPADPAWLAGWRAADDRAQAAIESVLGDALSEPRVARELGTRLRADTTVFVASSMPIRDVETFWPAREDGPRVLANRGANGIDGTVSAAFGAAAVEGGGPVVLLIGDVALAHDIGGLLAARRLGLALTIVLLNNDGGGIFEFLPVSCERDAFEEHVATPHGLDFTHAAALYGCAYVRPDTLDGLRAALDAAITRDDVTLIEVRTDRAENLALHRRVNDEVAPRTCT
nr:2-succinyl-5-enolpyruvyl-6-hydroxy-3-cyclohexene-1-carboxylic-acid synthase [Solirubrobacterales bacterium]